MLIVWSDEFTTALLTEEFESLPSREATHGKLVTSVERSRVLRYTSAHTNSPISTYAYVYIGVFSKNKSTLAAHPKYTQAQRNHRALFMGNNLEPYSKQSGGRSLGRVTWYHAESMAADSNALPDQCAFATSFNLNLTKCTCALLNGNSLLTSSLSGGTEGVLSFRRDKR